MALLNSLTAIPRHGSFVVWIGNAIAGLASNRPMVFFVLPLAVALGGLVLRARAKKDFSIEAYESLFGFDLGATACVVLPIAGFALINKQPSTDALAMQEATYFATGLFGLLLIFVVVLIVGALFMNKWGWAEGKKVKPAWWVVINVCGGLMLWIAYLAVGDAT